MARNVVRAALEQQARLSMRLYQLGAQIPPRRPWDDDVTYNDALLEAVELAEERLARLRHRQLSKDAS